MEEFKRLSLSDFDILYDFFIKSDKRICDFTPGTAIMWRNFFSTEYAVMSGSLVFRFNYFGKTAYSYPCGGDETQALKSLLSSDNEIMFCNLTDGDISVLKKYALISDINDDMSWYDYLYLADTFKTYAGKKLSGQRNHVNRFNREYPDSHTEIICESNLLNVRRFYESTVGDGSLTGTALADENIVFEVLDNYDKYHQNGVALFDRDMVIAFSIGENMNDTLYAHIEKANTAYTGAYQKIASEFVRTFATKKTVYLNREEDLGNEGLRKSKQSYHPVDLLKKVTALCKKNNF